MSAVPVTQLLWESRDKLLTLSRLTTASAQAGGAFLPACSASTASHTCPQPVPAGLRGFGAQVMAGIQVPLFHGTWCQVSRPPSTAPGWSQLVGYLLTLPHTYDQAQTVFQSRVCSRPACLLPGSWAVCVSMATGFPTAGDQVLDKLCTSAPASATKALLHVPPDTSPSCLPHPMTMRRYSQTQMESVGTQGLC